VIATYVDTSAILRLVYRHGDYSKVEHALGGQPTSSVLARVEARVSILRRWHGGELSDQDRDHLLALAESSAFDSVQFLVLDDSVMGESMSLAERFPLRTLDSLHLASAVVADRRLARRGHLLRFCTADREQAAAAATLFGGARVDVLPP
jgi:predicted nucleic acid-binding protein